VASPRLLLLVASVACAGCAEIIGADFDVEPLPPAAGVGGAGGGGGGGGGAGEAGGAGPCPEGATVIASAAPHPFGIAVGTEYVIWTEDGRVRRARKDGTGEPELVQGDLAGPNRIEVEDDVAYFTVLGSGAGTPDGALWHVDLHSGVADEIAGGITTGIGIAVRDGIVYLATGASVDGGNPILVFDTNEVGAVPTTFVSAPNGAGFLAAGEDALYGSSSIAGAPYHVWKKAYGEPPGTAPTQAVEVAAPVSVVRIASGLPLYSAYDLGPIDRYAADLTVAPFELVPPTNQLADMVVAGEWLYYADFAAGELRRVGLGGGTRELVATLSNVNGLASDGEFVYAAQNQPEGAVCRFEVAP
jgi:hypothetical protein